LKIHSSRSSILSLELKIGLMKFDEINIIVFYFYNYALPTFDPTHEINILSP